MEKTKTLPPLVRGRVTAVLDFFVDKISVSNISLLMDTFDLVAQIQWWGEDLPTFIRPEKACYQRHRINRNSDSGDTHFRCVRYEIKTTLELFKLYLKTCEVLELCVLDAVKKCIIGSAFLRDLVNLLSKSNDFITAPVFDYLGEKIGEIVICFRLLVKSEQIGIEKEKDVEWMHKNENDGISGGENFEVSKRIKKSSYIPANDNFLSTRRDNCSFEDLSSEPSVIKSHSGKTEKTYFISHDQIDSTNKDSKTMEKVSANDVKVPEREIYSCKCLPEITTSNDSSKILYFGSNSQKIGQNICPNINPKVRMKNKYDSNSIKYKSKSKSAVNLRSCPSNHSLPIGGSFKNKPASPAVAKNFEKKSDEILIKQNRVSSLEQFSHSEELSNHHQTIIKDAPSKSPMETKVLDYLLGSNLSKEDEESAISEFKKMSPCQNLVISLNQLCLTSDDSESREFGNRHLTGSLGPPQKAYLSFDFNNPIERNYYEKFFLNSDFSADLELAEILNRPENSAVLEKLKSEEGSGNKGGSQFSGSLSSEFPLGDKTIGKQNENLLGHYNRINDNAKGCARCKYYKKLDELDKIIESLKHFETKMLMHDKDMESAFAENSKIYTKRCQLNNS